MNLTYFSIQNQKDVHTGNYYPEAIPDNGLVDVYQNHHWKLGSLKEEVPNIILKEYKLDYSRWTASLARFLTVAKGLITNTNLDPYKSMYLGDETKFVYNLPYIKNEGESIKGTLTNSWNSTDGSIFGGLQKYFPALTQIGNTIGSFMSTGWGTEPLVSYKNSGLRTITIHFPLFNTLDLESANDNFSFVNLFYFQNLKTRTSWTTYLPPKVYEVSTPSLGGVYFPIAYVSNFSVTGIGQTRSITDFGSVTNRFAGGGLLDIFGEMGLTSSSQRLMPEAYIVRISLTEMLPNSVNIDVGSLGYKKVSVVSGQSGLGSLGFGDGREVGLNTASQQAGLAVDTVSDSFRIQQVQQQDAQRRTQEEEAQRKVTDLFRVTPPSPETPPTPQFRETQQPTTRDLPQGGTVAITFPNT